MEFDLEKYSLYYSLNELIIELGKNNLELEKIIQLNLKELFNLSVEYCLLDLIEYLYVFEGIEYELNDLIEKSNPNITSSSNASYVSEVVIYDYSAKEGININYLDKSNMKIQKSIKKIVGLKKYSKLTSKNKKFYYKFNPKYEYIFV